jgi:hypothetical protein
MMNIFHRFLACLKRLADGNEGRTVDFYAELEALTVFICSVWLNRSLFWTLATVPARVRVKIPLRTQASVSAGIEAARNCACEVSCG